MRLLLTICFVFSAVYAREINSKTVSMSTPDSAERSGRKKLILDGHNIDIRKAPYQVSLVYRGEHHCGGSIIAKDIILTAAHCVVRRSISDFQIRVGSSYSSNGGLLVPVAKLIYHPKFARISPFDFDVALLKLGTLLKFSDTVKPIKMMEDGEEIDDGAITYVSGWGTTQDGVSKPPSILQQVSVRKVNQKDCRSKYPAGTIRKTMLCAGVPGGGKDACQGDSGGPLVHDRKLAGVVSGGKGCGIPNIPGVYAKVSALRTWIDDNIIFLRNKN